jgi:DNA-binding XRE family transcriptional regulator
MRMRMRRRRLDRFLGRHIVGHAGSFLSTVGRHAASVAPKAPGLAAHPVRPNRTVRQADGNVNASYQWRLHSTRLRWVPRPHDAAVTPHQTAHLVGQRRAQELSPTVCVVDVVGALRYAAAMKTDVSPAYAVLGLNIQRARVDAQLTQEALGRRVGLSRTSINNIEHGRQKIFVHTLLQMAEACRIEPAGLLPRQPILPPDVAGWTARMENERGGDRA